ncbi:hypothetical protein Bca52824_054179 [Brassica carinata]|uniref:Uncharacterized protein n=1 Tax=Brassica carinata TaxID=52824 RepID=A0A8X7ULL4_BRACI|nr:hypothetical protein Bca52824_054179 [Brassica carinata]
MGHWRKRRTPKSIETSLEEELQSNVSVASSSPTTRGVFKEHNYLGHSGLAEDDKAAISLKATELTVGLPVSRSPVYTEKIWTFTTDSQTKSHATTIIANNFRGKGYEFPAQAARIREMLEHV